MSQGRRLRLRLRSSAAVLGFLAAAAFARADWVVQVAAYAERENLVEGSARLQKAGFPVVTEQFTPKVGGPLTRLLVGPYLERKAAEAMATRLKAAGWPGYVRRYAPASPPAKPATVVAAAPTATTPARRPTEILPPAPRSLPAAPAPTPVPVSSEPSRPAPAPSPSSARQPEADAEIPVPPPIAPAPISLPATGASTGGRGGGDDFKLFGSYQLEGAYTAASPAHGSKFKSLIEAGATGTPAEGIRWKLSGRFWYDAIYDVTHFYPKSVRDDARLFYDFRESYLDVSLGDFDIRAGRQHIIWGEVVGLFFADVVSARELHEFLARDLESIRIPQWALRVEWTKGDFHAEVINFECG